MLFFHFGILCDFQRSRYEVFGYAKVIWLRAVFVLSLALLTLLLLKQVFQIIKTIFYFVLTVPKGKLRCYLLILFTFWTTFKFCIRLLFRNLTLVLHLGSYLILRGENFNSSSLGSISSICILLHYVIFN